MKLGFSRFILFASTFAFAAMASAEMKVIGHRGFALYYPENTLASYAACKGVADMFEIDLRKTADGQFVSFHDDNLARTTRDTLGNPGSGSIESKTLAELRTLDAGSWKGAAFAGEKIPTFAEIVNCARANNLKICIERKGGTVSVDDAYNLIMANECADLVVMQSFDYTFTKAFAARMPGIPTGILTDGATASANAATYKTDGLNFASCSGMSATYTTAIHNAGLEAYAWTVNGKSSIDTHRSWGIDTVITDDPATASGNTPEDPVIAYVPGTMGNSMVSYWPLDGNGTDIKGAQPGTVTGAPSWITGKFGQALVPAASAFVNVPQTAASTPTSNSITLSVWVRFDKNISEMSGSYGSVFDSAADGYVIYADKTNNELRFKVTTVSGKAARPGIAASALTVGTWHHIAAVYDGNKPLGGGMAYIYLNGTKMSELPLGTVSTDLVKGQQTGLGCDSSSPASTVFPGAVDEVVMWNRALTNGDIKEIYTRGQAGVTMNDFLNMTSVSDWSLQ